MNHKDLMKEWFKELPPEQPSPDFTVKVMQRVMSEWTLNPVKYQPIISRRGWWALVIIALIITSFLFLIHSYLPTGTESAGQAATFYDIDLSQLFAPLNRLIGRLNNLSPTVAIGTLAIIALWFFDQLIVRAIRR
jgi:hypothetical protein